MPINNDSLVWPKVLICTKCQQPVERGRLGAFKVGSHLYSCPTCNAWVSPTDTAWIKESQVQQDVLTEDNKTRVFG